MEVVLFVVIVADGKAWRCEVFTDYAAAEAATNLVPGEKFMFTRKVLIPV